MGFSDLCSAIRDKVSKPESTAPKESDGSARFFAEQEATSIELWREVCPQLEDALELYDKRESAPDKTWNPLGDSKAVSVRGTHVFPAHFTANNFPPRVTVLRIDLPE
jgi:hypothetical protein